MFAPLDAVAAAAGVSVEDMRTTLRACDRRGPCADKAAAADAVAHRACPPPFLRSIPRDARPALGAAIWCARCVPDAAGFPPFAARAVAHKSTPRRQRELAASGSCPPAAAPRMAGEDYGPGVKESLLTSPSLTSAAVRVLALDSHRGVRIEVAAHPGCPEDVLAAFSRDDNREVVCAAVTHPGCSPGRRFKMIVYSLTGGSLAERMLLRRQRRRLEHRRRAHLDAHRLP